VIITISGMPGAGKSYIATKLIYDAWKKDPDRRIFTNYPVMLNGKSTLKWEPEYTCENIQNSIVVVDEAYHDYNSRKSLKEGGLSEQDHDAFSTNRHYGNTYIFISQNINRIDTIIREIGEIWWITKFALPNIRYPLEFDKWKPIWIKIEMFDCLDSFKLKAMIGKKAAYKRKRYRFSKKIAEMYNTHYFGDNTDPPFVSEPWFKEVKNEQKRPGLFDKLPYIHRIIQWSNNIDRTIDHRIREILPHRNKHRKPLQLYERRSITQLVLSTWLKISNPICTPKGRLCIAVNKKTGKRKWVIIDQ
jgi:hypothetical protein